MKNLKFIAALLITVFFLSFSNAQTIKPLESDNATDTFTNNVYYKDTNNVLQNLVGTWEYSNGSDYFKVTFYMVLKEIENPFSNYNRYRDRLYAKYIYKKNGVTKYDNYGLIQYSATSTVNTKPTDLKSAHVKNSKISFLYDEPSFTDCYRRKNANLHIQFVSGTPPQLTWVRTVNTRSFNSTPCDNGAPLDDSDFIIPANMVLTKVN